MSDVIDFKSRKEELDLVLVCECSSQSFYVHQSLKFVCCSCNRESTVTNSEMRVALPKPPPAPKSNADAATVILSPVGIGPRRIIKDTDPDAVVVILVVDDQGRSRSWNVSVDTQEQRDWVKRNLMAATKDIIESL